MQEKMNTDPRDAVFREKRTHYMQPKGKFSRKARNSQEAPERGKNLPSGAVCFPFTAGKRIGIMQIEWIKRRPCRCKSRRKIAKTVPARGFAVPVMATARPAWPITGLRASIRWPAGGRNGKTFPINERRARHGADLCTGRGIPPEDQTR